MADHLASANGSSEPTVAIHVDLDGARHIYRSHSWPYDGDDDLLFETGFLGMLRVFAEEEVRATLFLIAEDLDHPAKRPLVERAVDEGHEIASHTSTHRLLSRLEPAERQREIADSRDYIRSELGVEVDGFRAPAFDFNRDDLTHVADAGYRWDSSALPRHYGELGVRGVRGPFHPLPDRDLLEIPLPDCRPLPLPTHPSYSLILGEWYFRLGLLSRGGSTTPLVLLFHLTDFSAPFERAKGVRERLFTISHRDQESKIEACRRMLRRVRATRGLVMTSEVVK